MVLKSSQPQNPQEQIKFWQAQDIGQLELLHATYITHTFARHIHTGYAIGVIERGAETFYYQQKMHIAGAGSVVVINPGEVHTGQAVTDYGWTYRMLYPDVALVQKAAREVYGKEKPLPYFAHPVIQDDELAGIIRQLHLVLERSSAALERETYFLLALTHLIARHADGAVRFPAISKSHKGILRAQDFLKECYADDITLEQLASIAQLSPFHFARLFNKTIGLAPHAYLIHVRVEQAKKLLSQAYPIAQVAAETGFSDQSHLTRRFKRIVGVTPGRYHPQ